MVSSYVFSIFYYRKPNRVRDKFQDEWIEGLIDRYKNIQEIGEYSLYLWLDVIFFLKISDSQTRAFIDPLDVIALRDLYRTLKYT